MGAWGHGPFDNDDAADWHDELEEAGDARAFLLETFTGADGDYLDADEGFPVVAAASWLVSTEDERRQWDVAGLAAPPQLDDDLRAAALRAVDAVLSGGSEWRELWAEAEETAPVAALTEVRDRLGR